MTEDERKIITYVREVSTAQLVQELSDGKVLGTDLRAIGKLRLYRLPEEVKNVLLYCAKCKMSKQTNYKDVYKIAARWNRLRVQTAEEAFELAKQEGCFQQQR
ncbi:DnaD domain protein [Domibacillus sp. PGB-M46]|uniref:DnaD domain protein n=1 Tax=Domibacillus sp. PGB-M46 TaxID=2910255 RepID=UPI001F5A06AE|nr:DnaD domain protein [Domibacillus sp. PGB-M46]MCI2254604.1 DnaD domain protein [Domibacillus sp. PGB-M46]